MSNYFPDSLNVVLIHEGGSSFTDNVNDPGGATKYGISLRFLKNEGVDIDHDGDIDADDVKNLDEAGAERLYSTFFWSPMQCDNFSQVVAAKLFDVAVNVGTRRGTMLAQQAALTEADGLLGPQTLRAILAMDPRLFIANVERVQTDFYEAIVASRPASAEFLEGWKVRAGCSLYTPCRTCEWKGRKPLLSGG
jgi:lysozyme family protein